MKADDILGKDADLEAEAYGKTKRLTKLPLALICGFVGIALIFTVFGVASSGSKKQVTSEEEEKIATTNNRREFFIDELSPDVTVIEQKKLDLDNLEEELAKDTALIEEKGPVEEKPLALQPPQPLPVQDPGPTEEELASLELQRKIMMQKREAFELALVSKTSVDLGSTSGSSSGFGHSSMSEQDRVQAEIEATQRRIEQLQSGNYGGTQVITGGNLTNSGGVPTELGEASPYYDALNDGVSGTGAGEGYSKFNRHGSWDLQNLQEAPTNPYIVRAGMVIPATLISGINSDLAGQIIGQVSQSVYDSATGKYLLIPQGTRLIGAYSTGDIKYGQERVMIAWQRLEFPDGKVLDLGSMPGTDVSGYSGFTDEVDNHWWKLISSAFLMSGITAGVVVATDTDENNNMNNSNSTSVSDELKSAMATQFGNVIAKVIERNLNIAPTLKIRPGYRFNVMVTKDMNFAKPFEAFDYKKKI